MATVAATVTATVTATAATTAATTAAATTTTTTRTTHADAAMDIKDETTEDTKDATLDTKDADAVVDAAKEVNAQERRHNHESIAGPTASNCAHASTECNYKDDGHIDGATYSNKQGGSTHNCNGADS